MRIDWVLAAIAAVAAIAASACMTTRATVTPFDIAQQARPLMQDGSAVVTSPTSAIRVSADEVVTIRIREGDLERTLQVTVRELVAGCVDDAAAPGCLAAQAVAEPALERRQIRFDRARAETAGSFGLMFGAVGVCLAACGDTSSLERGAAIAGGGVLALAALFLLVGSLGH
ncbi:MAG TPA: hypothetical protein VNO30_38355 [Kofleriaceae bacterium]|nr:hypothetical protein [Kofleriaceae bacterium]